MNDDIIGDVLDIDPLPPRYEIIPAESVTTAASNSQIDTDFEYARGHVIAAIEKGQEALSGIVDVAGMSQHPRSFEVVATLVNAVTSASKELLELSKKKKDITQEAPGSGSPSTVNNNLFVGSTAELQKLLKKQNEQN